MRFLEGSGLLGIQEHKWNPRLVQTWVQLRSVASRRLSTFKASTIILDVYWFLLGGWLQMVVVPQFVIAVSLIFCIRLCEHHGAHVF